MVFCLMPATYRDALSEVGVVVHRQRLRGTLNTTQNTSGVYTFLICFDAFALFPA